MKDGRPGKLPGGSLQAIEDGFVRQEDLGLSGHFNGASRIVNVSLGGVR